MAHRILLPEELGGQPAPLISNGLLPRHAAGRWPLDDPELPPGPRLARWHAMVCVTALSWLAEAEPGSDPGPIADVLLDLDFSMLAGGAACGESSLRRLPGPTAAFGLADAFLRNAREVAAVPDVEGLARRWGELLASLLPAPDVLRAAAKRVSRDFRSPPDSCPVSLSSRPGRPHAVTPDGAEHGPLTRSEAEALGALIAAFGRALAGKALVEKTGVSSPDRHLRALHGKYPGLQPYLRLPDKKGRGYELIRPDSGADSFDLLPPESSGAAEAA